MSKRLRFHAPVEDAGEDDGVEGGGAPVLALQVEDDGDAEGDDDADTDTRHAVDQHLIEVDGVAHAVPAAVRARMEALAGEAKAGAAASARAAEVDKAREGLAADRAAFEAQLSGQTEGAAMAALDGLIAAFSQLDWAGVARADPAFAQGAWGRYTETLRARAALEAQREDRVRAAQAWEKESQGRAAREAVASLAGSVPGWSAETPKALAEFAKTEFDFAPDEVAAVTDPRLLKLLHRAWSVTDQNRRVARAQAGQATEPAITLKGSGGPVGTRADTDDFAAFERMFDSRMKGRAPVIKTVGAW